MNLTLRTWILCGPLLLAGISAQANTSLPHIFSDNMVLQRGKPVPVWGWAKPGEVVKVSFAGQTKNAKANAEGDWMVHLDAMQANKTSQDMIVSGENSITIKNILVGEVWLCSGQSNMARQLNSSLNGEAEVAAANYPTIRYVYTPPNGSTYPQNDVKCEWQVGSPRTLASCTAVGYFFARELVKELDVPVGLFNSSVDGTYIEPWTCREGFNSVPELKDMSKRIDTVYPDNEVGLKNFQEYNANLKSWLPLAQKAISAKQIPPAIPAAPAMPEGYGPPCCLFNGEIQPFIPFAIRGALWYQGESNGGEGDSYFQKMKALVGGWRKLWKEGDFPFYWVQLPNFKTSDSDKPAMGDDWAKTREAQLKALELPNTGMAVGMDIGESNNIHPKDKQDVGKRLAAWALAKDYGKKIEYSGPIYQKNLVKGNKIFIAFDHVGKGLMIGEKSGLEAAKEIVGGKLKWISIAGEDKKFYWADAVIDGSNLVVSSNKVQNPVAVRYAYTDNPTGPLLYNKEGFPASPFRTDVW